MALSSHQRYSAQQKEQLLQSIEQAMEWTGRSAEELLPELGLPSATYYRWKERAQQEQLEDRVVIPHRPALLPTSQEEEAVQKFALEYSALGYKRLTYLMMDEDVAVLAPTQVYDILGKHHLMQRRGSVSSEALRRPQEPDHPDQVWHIDLMYLHIGGKWYYLVDILDGYSRMLVHFSLNTTMHTDTVTLTMQQALDQLSAQGRKRCKDEPRVVHDHGSQFTGADWRALVQGNQITDIKTRVAHPQSNGRLERLHRTHREEGLAAEEMVDYYRTLQALCEWQQYYNQRRPHSALQYLCPCDYYDGNIEARLEQRKEKLAAAQEARRRYWQSEERG